MTAQVTIVLDEAKNVLTVPSSAVTKTPRGTYLVGVYDPTTGKTEPHRVTVGINNNVTAEIQSGLNEGDLVVATGVTRFGGGGRGQNANGQNGQGAQAGQNGQGGQRQGQGTRGGGLGRLGGPGGPGGLLGL